MGDRNRTLLFAFSYTKLGSPAAGQHVGRQQNTSKFQTCGLFATMTLAIGNCRCRCRCLIITVLSYLRLPSVRRRWRHAVRAISCPYICSRNS